MHRPDRSSTADWLLWLGLAAVVTLVLLGLRNSVDKAHVALAYLLVVLGGSARSGRALGLTLAVLSFLCFNFFFLSPYYTLQIHNPLDWLVLLAFLVTSAVAAQLLYRVQVQAESATRRAGEVDRLAALGAETLNAPRAEDAVRAIAELIRKGLDASICEIYQSEGAGQLRLIARSSDEERRRTLLDPVSWLVPLAEILIAADARVRLLPLLVRGQSVGVLRLENDSPIVLDAAQERFAQALAYYAALGVERAQLTAEAAHAEALREADRLKDALLASVSHDLRTPLTTIKALAHEIAASGDERAVVVEEEADRLNRFVSDLLDLSRLNAGELHLQLELVAAEDLVGAALQRVSGAAGVREIRASIESSDPIMVARLDFVQALRVLVNLIDNALKYSDTPVEVSVGYEGARVCFSVTDAGPGIPPAMRERIFESFFRGAGRADAGGTGLGLAIARRLAEAQGGELRYAPRPGGGSVFSLLLPAAEPEELERMFL